MVVNAGRPVVTSLSHVDTIKERVNIDCLTDSAQSKPVGLET